MPEEYISKAQQKLDASICLYNAGFYDDSISRSYYSIYHSVKAFFHKKGKEESEFRKLSHGGILGKLGIWFIKNGLLEVKYARMFGRALERRKLADYTPSLVFSKNDAKEILDFAREFMRLYEQD